MPKTNPALLLLALLSVGAFASLKNGNKDQVFKEVDQALVKLTGSLRDHCYENDKEISLDQFMENVIADLRQEIDSELSDLKKELKQEQLKLAKLENNYAVAKESQGVRKAQVKKQLAYAQYESNFQKIYFLEKEIEDKQEQLQSLTGKWVV